MAGTAGPLTPSEAFEKHVQHILNELPSPERIIHGMMVNLKRQMNEQCFDEAVSLHHRSCPARKGGKECTC